MQKPFKNFSKIKDELSSILPSSFISPLLDTVGTSSSGNTPTNPYVSSLFDEFVGMIGNFNSKARNLQDLTKNIEDFSVIGKVKVDIWCTDNYNAPGSGIRCSAVWMQEEYLRNPYIVVKITLNNQYAFVYQRVIVPSTKIFGAAQGDPTLIYAWGRGCWGLGQDWVSTQYMNLTGSQGEDQYQAFAFPMVFKHLFNTTVNCSANIGYQGPNSSVLNNDNGAIAGLLYGVPVMNSYDADYGYSLFEISPTGGIVNLNHYSYTNVSWEMVNPYIFGCAVSAWGMVDIDAVPGSNSCNNGNSKWVNPSSLYPWYDLTNLYPEGKNYLSAGDSFSLTFNLLCLQAHYNTIGIKQVPGWVVTKLPSWITVNTGAQWTGDSTVQVQGLGNISGTVPADTDANYQTGVLNFSVMVGDGAFSMAEIPLSIQVGDPTLPENQGTIPLVGGYVDPTKPVYGYNITLNLNTSQVLSGYTASNNQDIWSTNSLSLGLANELIEGLNPSPTLIYYPYAGPGWNDIQNIEYWYLACTAPNGVGIDPAGNLNSSDYYADAYTNWSQWMNFNTGQVQYMTTQGNPSSGNFPITQMVSSSFIPSTSYPYMPRSLVSPSFPQGIEWDQSNCIGMTSSSAAGSMWDSTTSANVLRREGFFTTNFMISVSDGLITQSSIIQLYWDLIPNNYQRLVRYPDEDYVLPTVTWEYSQIPSSWSTTGMKNCIPLPTTTQLQEYIDQNPDDFPIAQLLCSLSVTQDDEHQFLNPQMAGRPPLPNNLYINGSLTTDTQNSPAPVIYQLFQGTYDVQPLTPDNTIVLKGAGSSGGSGSFTSTNQYPPLVTANYDSSVTTWSDLIQAVGPLLQFGLGEMPESTDDLIWVMNPYTGTITINLAAMKIWLEQNSQVPSYAVSNEDGDFTFYCLKPVVFYSDYFVCYQPLQLEIWFALPSESTSPSSSSASTSTSSGGG